jgi:ATP synthase subunit 6
MLLQYSLFQHCNRTVLSCLPKFNIVHSRNHWGEKAFGAAKYMYSKTKTKGLQAGHTARKHFKKAIAPKTVPQWIIGTTLLLAGIGANEIIKRIETNKEVKAALADRDNGVKAAIAAKDKAERDLEEAKAAKDKAERDLANEKNSVDNVFKDLVENKRLEASAKNKSIVLTDDCDNRSILTRGWDNYNHRECVSTDALRDQAIAHAKKYQSNLDKDQHSKYSPFENFELILFFPSFGFLFLFLFTSFNLVLFQIILMLFNLHEFLISTFRPNSFILRSNAVLMTFLFNLHCSQSYSQFLLKYFPITLTVFIFILFGNLTGLLPWSFSYTGHIGLTFSLGIMLFQGWLVVGLDRLGGDFWALFIPHNCPKWLFPLMLVIEILSFVIRPFSLAIRLFANILSGHILLHLIKETEEIIRDSENNGYMNMIPSNVSSLVSLSESMVLILELGVACLQGYIFVILSSIYLQESVNERVFGSEVMAQVKRIIKRKALEIWTKPKTEEKDIGVFEFRVLI